MKSKRKQIQEKLIKFATRIPVFMYLTDYRERCLKDVITQLEPGLFKKVTGLSVEDFNMLCSLGVFNAPLMNDAIFKFKRYEDSSLTYTGVNRHANDEVGGWDTTIRREQYERLFYNQQTSMTTVDSSSYLRVENDAESKPKAKRMSPEVSPMRKPIVSSHSVAAEPAPEPLRPMVDEDQAIDVEALKERLSSLEAGDSVVHKKFGTGKVVRMNKNEKFIHVRFLEGEKKFVFPDAFLSGFLSLK